MFISTKSHGLNKLQRTAAGLMGVMVLVTFLATNAQAVLWQSSQWLVSTVLPAVVVNLTNGERADNNAPALRRSAVLDAAAQLKADDMAKNQYFAHYAPDGTTPWHWFDVAGYKYAHAGENLAIHFTDSSEVVDAWMDSPLHRKNIVDGKFTEIGVGTAKGKFDGYNTVYVVQLFGTPAAAPAQPVAAKEPVVAVAQAAAPAASTQAIETQNADVLAAADTNSEATELSKPAVESAQEPVEQTGDVEPTRTTPETQTADSVESEITETNTAIAVDSELTEVEAVPEEDVVVVESTLVATSSGLAAASINGDGGIPETISAAGFATRPHLVLEIVYALLALTVSGLLIASVIIEARRLHPVQVAYGGGMMATMALLLWLHTILVSGAVIA